MSEQTNGLTKHPLYPTPDPEHSSDTLEDRIAVLETEVEKLKNVSMLLQMAERMNEHYSRQQLQSVSPVQDIPDIKHDTSPTLRQKTHHRPFSVTAQVFEQSTSPILIVDGEGRLLHINPAAEALSGYVFYEVKDRYLWEVFVPDGDILRVRQNFNKRLATRIQQLPYTMRWLTKAGHIRHIFWADTFVYHHDDVLNYIICSGIDITAHRTVLEQVATQPMPPESSSYTPIIPITEHIISVLLVGNVDPTRTMEIIHDMRNSIKQHHARIAILDIGRLSVVTPEIAVQIRHIMQAARLLNTCTFVTHTPDAIAETILTSEIDLSRMDSPRAIREALGDKLSKLEVKTFSHFDDL